MNSKVSAKPFSPSQSTVQQLLSQINDLPNDLNTKVIEDIFSASKFVARQCKISPDLLLECLRSARPQPSSYRSDVQLIITNTNSEQELMRVIRRYRQREMARIAFFDLSNKLSLAEVFTATSDLADTLIDAVLEHLHAQLTIRFGTPRNSRGVEQKMIVLGMGKLGGQELNFSSDVDLIFTYPEAGQTDSEQSIDNSEFFLRLGQRLIKVLNETTEDGWVYRVDMRLRPFGNAGPIAVSFNALEQYYEIHGREWERYALIKARVVAGDINNGQALLNTLRPFIYRRYLDYGVIGSLRELKQKIAAEVASKKRHCNIKLGTGGIREIEFIGQVFQLMRGGQNTVLQSRSIIETLENLARGHFIRPEESEQMIEAYGFLRRLENRLQMYEDEQCHELPDDEDKRTLFATAMGFSRLDAFDTTLKEHRRRVCCVFNNIFHSEQDDYDQQSSAWKVVWYTLGNDHADHSLLDTLGFKDTQASKTRLLTFKLSQFYLNLSNTARIRLDELAPKAIACLIDSPDPDEALDRLLRVLRAIAGRSVYLSMMLEHSAVLTRFMRLISASAWVAEFVSQHPIVIDELLHPTPAHPHFDRALFIDETQQLLNRLPEADLGEKMDVLRQYKQMQLLRIVSADLDGMIDVVEVSRQLSALAEALLQIAADVSWNELTDRFGQPSCEINGSRVYPHFAIIAYGKLGSEELSYGSDLDLVFIHQSRGKKQHTNGTRPIENSVFFSRLAQKVVHFISTLTSSGTLYEVDTRLRPNGASGMLISSIDAFENYQNKQAWIWEHQALVRAKIIVADSGLKQRFNTIRRQILQNQPDISTLAHEVASMRQLMIDKLATSDRRYFDLKQSRGGVADIEFMVQYWALAWSWKYPELTRYTATLQLLQLCGKLGIISAQQAEQLTESYSAYRRLIHQRILQGESMQLEQADLDGLGVGKIVTIWQAIMPRLTPSSTKDKLENNNVDFRP